MIEIKELIIRATVDSMSAQATRQSAGEQTDQQDSSKAYLESIVNQLKEQNER